MNNKQAKKSLIAIISIILAILFLKIAFTLFVTIETNKTVIPENINFNPEKNYKAEIPKIKSKIKKYPEDNNLQVELATAYWASGDIQNAIKTTDKFNNKQLAAYNKALIYYSQKDYINTLNTIDKNFIEDIPQNCDKKCQYGYKMAQVIKTNSNWELNNYKEWIKNELKLFWIILIYGNI